MARIIQLTQSGSIDIASVVLSSADHTYGILDLTDNSVTVSGDEPTYVDSDTGLYSYDITALDNTHEYRVVWMVVDTLGVEYFITDIIHIEHNTSMMDSLEYTRRECYRYAGLPVLALEIDDRDFDMYVLSPTLHEYYTHAPYMMFTEKMYSKTCTDDIDIPDPTLQDGWNPTVTATFYGMVGYNFNDQPYPNIMGIGGATNREEAIFKFNIEFKCFID